MQKVHYIDVLSMVAVLTLTLATVPVSRKAPARVAPILTSTVPAPPRYDVIEIGLPPDAARFTPTAISPNAHYVVGTAYSDPARNHPRPVLWHDSIFRYLAKDEGNVRANHYEAEAVNDSGIAVGEYYDFDKHGARLHAHAIEWRQPGYAALRLFADNASSSARAIDNAGNIYGSHDASTKWQRRYQVYFRGEMQSESLEDDEARQRPFLQNARGETICLETEHNRFSIFVAANEHKQILLLPFHCSYWEKEKLRDPVGGTLFCDGASPELWNVETLRFPNTSRRFNPYADQNGKPPRWKLASSGDVLQQQEPDRYGELPFMLKAINDKGTIVGEYEREDGLRQAAIWLHGKPSLLPAPTTDSEAIGISNAGDVIGITHSKGKKQAAFLVHQNRAYYLRDLIPTKAHIATIDNPLRITGSGVILTGGVTTQGQEHMYLLKPK